MKQNNQGEDIKFETYYLQKGKQLTPVPQNGDFQHVLIKPYKRNMEKHDTRWR